MASSLSDLVNNLAEWIHNIKCKNEHDIRKNEVCGIKCKESDSFLEYTRFRDDLIGYTCFCCIKNYQKN